MAVPSQPLEGFYFDELSKVRVIEPDTAGETQELKDECKEFVESEGRKIFPNKCTSTVCAYHGIWL